MDVTAARRAEEGLQKARAELAHITRVTTLGELTASIAHEVNQPLTGVVTYGDACLRWLDHEVRRLDQARSAVEQMISSARHASDVIARIRALSKKGTLERARLDINKVIDDVIALIRREINVQSVSLRLDLGSSLPDRQYSCAYLETPDQSLDDAQLAKKRHIAAKLRVEPGNTVLDIGAGWGGLAGCFAAILSRMRTAGLAGRPTGGGC
jgi:signal transduction histidine kinase